MKNYSRKYIGDEICCGEECHVFEVVAYDDNGHGSVDYEFVPVKEDYLIDRI